MVMRAEGVFGFIRCNYLFDVFMQRLLLNCSLFACRGAVLLALLAGLLSQTRSASAQPANDNFASATALTGGWGSVSGDSSGATAEPGEPSHAGFPASASVWYQWTAPVSGQVSLDTLNSSFDTVVAVYTGTNVAYLTQVAANDDMFPANRTRFPIISGRVSYFLPFTGPSSLHFNATAGTTYYFAVDGAAGASGQFALSWAYHPGGVFRFATEDFDYSFTGGTGLPLYQCSEWETFSTENETTIGTYYDYYVPGVLVTVTRIGGAVGRVLVDYQTADVTAVAGVDYFPVSGTLVFDDFEMSKSIWVEILPSPPPNPFRPIPVDPATVETQMHRDFAVLLSNPRRAAAESPDVSDPRTDDAFATSLVRIWDADVDPILSFNMKRSTCASGNG